MKKLISSYKKTISIISCTLLLACGMFPMQASAAIITTDLLIGSVDSANSAEQTELDQLIFITGISNLEIAVKIELPEDEGFDTIGSTDTQWFLDVAPDTPGYFILKFGIGGTNATADTFFFKNIGELTLLVWENSQVQFLTGGACSTLTNCNIERLSHYVYTNDVEPEVPDIDIPLPEPSSVMLVGLGMLGFLLARRLNRNATCG